MSFPSDFMHWFFVGFFFISRQLQKCVCVFILKYWIWKGHFLYIMNHPTFILTCQRNKMWSICDQFDFLMTVVFQPWLRPVRLTSVHFQRSERRLSTPCPHAPLVSVNTCSQQLASTLLLLLISLIPDVDVFDLKY